MRYQEGKQAQEIKLQSHVDVEGRTALTADGRSRNNKFDYEVVTAHYLTRDGETIAVLLDIIELTEPVF